MKINLNSIVLIIAIFLFPKISFSQNIGEIVLKMRNVLRKIERKIESGKGKNDYLSKIVKIKDILSSLNEKYQNTNTTFPSDYLASLENDVMALEKVYSLPDDSIHSILDFVKRDLNTKNTTPNSANASEVVYKNITVIVKVVQNGKAVNGYTITANPEFWSKGAPMYRFNNLSSPTDAIMQPGEYIFYVSLSEKEITEKYETVGNSKGDLTHTVTIVLN